MYLPSSSAFFQGQIDAENGFPAPEKPKFNASYDEKMYFRGYVQQQRKMAKLAAAQAYRLDVFAFAL